MGATVSRPCPADRHALALSAVPLVRGVVLRLVAAFRLLRLAPLDDLLSEGMLAATAAARDFDPSRGDWKPYARRCVDRQIKDFARRMTVARRRGELTGPRFSDMGAGVPGLGPFDPADRRATTADDLCRRMDASEAVAAALRAVPERSRLVLRLRHCRGLTLPEIALQIGVSSERVRQIEAEALAAARRALIRGGCRSGQGG